MPQSLPERCCCGGPSISSISSEAATAPVPTITNTSSTIPQWRERFRIPFAPSPIAFPPPVYYCQPVVIPASIQTGPQPLQRPPAPVSIPLIITTQLQVVPVYPTQPLPHPACPSFTAYQVTIDDRTLSSPAGALSSRHYLLPAVCHRDRGGRYPVK